VTSAAPRSGSSPGLLIASAFVVVLGSIGTCAAYFLAPRGERVGAIDLTAPAPLTVNLAAPSTLSFRLEATLPAPTSENSSREAAD